MKLTVNSMLKLGLFFVNHICLSVSMMTKELTKSTLNRLLAINWRADDSRIDSHVALFQEYLRRMSLWARALDCQNLWPFFDVAAEISPSIEVPEEAIAQLREHLANFRLRKNIKQTCEWYLRWGAMHGFFCVSSAWEIQKKNKRRKSGSYYLASEELRLALAKFLRSLTP